MPAYCEVALPVPLDHTFTYAVREGQRPLRGARVIAPFRNEKLIGVVTGLNAKAPPDVEMRYLEAVLDEEPLLSEQLLALAEWMAGYYLAPLGEVLRGMLPLMAEALTEPARPLSERPPLVSLTSCRLAPRGTVMR